MSEVLHFENVGLRYGLGPEILRDITFGLEAGSFHFLVGASGAGKSSLLRLMYLAQRPSRGMVSLFNRDVLKMRRSDLPSLRRRMGVVFQNFRLLPHLSAFDNVALPLRVIGVRESEIQRHVEELLSWVGLHNHL
ncbi:MAG: ATP-binding cassette domain-containing protein, partial [Rhodospirillales bacterium]|nr:ATP-binding cassette domain-containing protein [Rhodospirillales bacterium]